MSSLSCEMSILGGVVRPTSPKTPRALNTPGYFERAANTANQNPPNKNRGSLQYGTGRERSPKRGLCSACDTRVAVSSIEATIPD